MLETDVSLDVVEKSTLGVLDLFPIHQFSPQSLTPSPCLSALGTDHYFVHVAKSHGDAFMFDTFRPWPITSDSIHPSMSCFFSSVKPFNTVRATFGHKVHCLETDSVYCHCEYLFVKKAMPKKLTPLNSKSK